MIDFKCDCGEIVSVPDSLAGQIEKCPTCRREVQVPAAPPPAEKSQPEEVAIRPGAITSWPGLASITAIGSVWAGWLFLSSIGMVLAPLGILTELGDLAKSRYLLPSSFDAWTKTVTVFDLLKGAFWLFVVFPYFTKKRYAPPLMVAFIATTVCMSLVAEGWASSIIGASVEIDFVTDVMTKARLFVPALWIPYFLLSERVKATFVR